MDWCYGTTARRRGEAFFLAVAKDRLKIFTLKFEGNDPFHEHILFLMGLTPSTRTSGFHLHNMFIPLRFIF